MQREGLVVGRGFIEGRAAARILVPDIGPLSAAGLDEIDIRLGGPSAKEERILQAANELANEGHEIYGVTGEGTSIEEIRLELLHDRDVSAGDLLWTMHSDDDRLFWQVAEASIKRIAWGGDSHRLVIASAHQVGTWNENRSAFDFHTRSPSLSEPIYSGLVGPAHLAPLPAGQAKVGTIPRTDFPVRLDLRELSLHHAAILGTTGTGKTHLSFHLANQLATSGTKVICVDTTDQYRKRFGESAQGIDYESITQFLDSDHKLAVYRPDADKSTILDGRALSKRVFEWAKTQPELKEEDPARLVLIFEEAQNFVPEGFVVDEWALKTASQETSRIIMESRKFGLGFILVSQRTAMVTKSALSQCNTVFAFQAFDQTGLDYLEGICGAALAKGIPGLPRQTAIVMGRGLTSSRPLIVRISDAEVVVT